MTHSLLASSLFKRFLERMLQIFEDSQFLNTDVKERYSTVTSQPQNVVQLGSLQPRTKIVPSYFDLNHYCAFHLSLKFFLGVGKQPPILPPVLTRVGGCHRVCIQSFQRNVGYQT